MRKDAEVSKAARRLAEAATEVAEKTAPPVDPMHFAPVKFDHSGIDEYVTGFGPVKLSEKKTSRSFISGEGGPHTVDLDAQLRDALKRQTDARTALDAADKDVERINARIEAYDEAHAR